MKTIIAMGLSALSIMMLGGCSTTHESIAMAQSKSAFDEGYIAQVEQDARAHGVDVQWIHPPQKVAQKPR